MPAATEIYKSEVFKWHLRNLLVSFFFVRLDERKIKKKIKFVDHIIAVRHFDIIVVDVPLSLKWMAYVIYGLRTLNKNKGFIWYCSEICGEQTILRVHTKNNWTEKKEIRFFLKKNKTPKKIIKISKPKVKKIVFSTYKNNLYTQPS